MRTWNLFHGNSVPPARRAYLEEMVRLAVADEPDVVCLQEVPAWALGGLEEWSGMSAFGEIAQRPRIGPFPSSAAVGRTLTSLNHGLLRSAFSGQANAILVRPDLATEDYHALVLNPRRFRGEEADRLGLGGVERLAWAKERRVAQSLRLVLPDGRRALVTNLHATSYPPDRRLADREVARAVEVVSALALGAIEVLAGDFNLFPHRSATLKHLAEAGFTQAGPEVDHVFVRGAAVTEVDRWEPERRRIAGVLVSDHPPLDVRFE